jgi:hypothetical protein
MTRARALELCAELSLIDIAALALRKMAGPDGLSASCACSFESTSMTHQVLMRVLSKKKQAEMRRLHEEAQSRRRERQKKAQQDEARRRAEETD